MKPVLNKRELVQFHGICDRNGVRLGRADWIYQLEKIVGDAAFDSLPGEDGAGTVTLSQRTSDMLAAWCGGLELVGEKTDLERAIGDFTMAAVVTRLQSGFTGKRFIEPSGHHERKWRNANSSTYLTKAERKAQKRGKR